MGRNNSSGFVGAKDYPKEKAKGSLYIKRIHIGVFFDGTSNNMVQQAHYKTFKNKYLFFSPEVNPLSSDFSSDQHKSYNELEAALKEKIRIRTQIALLEDQARRIGIFDKDEYLKLKDKLSVQNDKIEKLQSLAKIDTKAMHNDSQNGYSNVAILYSLINKQQNTSENYYYNIYIEGSGGDNLADRGSDVFDTLNGLGFGYDVKGVTSLVGKAVKLLYDYLSSIKSYLNEDTEYHFYVFGFSRGSTCARLFTQLTVREEGKDTLNCEREFAETYSRVKGLYREKENRLPFMERCFLSDKSSGNVYIKRKNVKVEFLGIYDTVASIGFLQQKDGWVNGLKKIEKREYYKDLYHYKNASEYGLYIPMTPQMGYTFHVCAADEFRENFALVNIGSEITNGLEIVIPGCHADIGGGYVSEQEIKERVLYNFIPRKKDNVGEEGTITTIWKKRMNFSSTGNIMMFLDSPNDVQKSQFGKLNLETLSKLGWVDQNWQDQKQRLYIDEKGEYPCTIRFSGDEKSRCVKFKKNSLGGYSNISLWMMLECVNKKGFNWLFKEFEECPYKIPTDLTGFKDDIAKAMIKYHNERIWIVPKGGYSGTFYRNLRLKYLHFTASCQLVNWRLNLKPVEIDWANFGNECNYDEDGRICRLMYVGDNKAPDTCKEGVRYMYEGKFIIESTGNYNIELYHFVPKFFKQDPQ